VSLVRRRRADGARPASTRIPITAGQSEITSHGVRRLLDAGAVDFVNVDVSECGGVTEWRRAAALCGAAGVQMAHHEESQISHHLLAAVAHGPTRSALPIPTAIRSGSDVGESTADQGRDHGRGRKPRLGLILDEGLVRSIARTSGGRRGSYRS